MVYPTVSILSQMWMSIIRSRAVLDYHYLTISNTTSALQPPSVEGIALYFMQSTIVSQVYVILYNIMLSLAMKIITTYSNVFSSSPGF